MPSRSTIAIEMQRAAHRISQLETELSATQTFLACVLAIYHHDSIILTKEQIEHVQSLYNDIEIKPMTVQEGFTITAIKSPSAEPTITILP